MVGRKLRRNSKQIIFGEENNVEIEKMFSFPAYSYPWIDNFEKGITSPFMKVENIV